MTAVRSLLPILLLMICVSVRGAPVPPGGQDEIAWQAWSPAAFEQARVEKKPVFLYLEAVWCHWCHVMQRETLSRRDVRERLARDYVVVRVDHDANPGLANRYRDYGWPALVFLSADGTDLVKRAGYIEPEPFARLLDAIARDPTPERASRVVDPPVGASRLTPADRAFLLARHDRSFDAELGGLRTAQKFIDRDSVEYALVHADDPKERVKAEKTLTAALALMDPVWGGASQYSTSGTWNHPHFEKIMRTQAAYLRIYALAYARLGRTADLRAARDIQRYLFAFLRSPEGAFYVSQDADVVPGESSGAYFERDDAGRRRLGVPRVDRHRYADANGNAAEALAILYAASGDASALAAARQAVEWTIAHRSDAKTGLMRHGDDADPNPHLSDSLAVARAGLALYEATSERRWLDLSRKLGAGIDSRLRATTAGFLTEAERPGLPVRPRQDLAENIAATRFFNRLAHYTGEKTFRDAALHAMKYLAGHASQQTDFEEAGILLADDELAGDPTHLTIVGAKSDPAARALFDAAMRTPASYRRIEWWDRTEGPLPHPDVAYPELTKPAAYVCTAGRCSRPSYEASDYAIQITRLTRAKKP